MSEVLPCVVVVRDARGEAPSAAHLAPRAGRGQHGKKENRNSVRVRGRLHESEPLRIVEAPPHPTLSPQSPDQVRGGRGSATLCPPNGEMRGISSSIPRGLAARARTA